MKQKIVFVMLIAAVFFSLAGCDSPSSQPTATPTMQPTLNTLHMPVIQDTGVFQFHGEKAIYKVSLTRGVGTFRIKPEDRSEFPSCRGEQEVEVFLVQYNPNTHKARVGVSPACGNWYPIMGTFSPTS